MLHFFPVLLYSLWAYQFSLLYTNAVGHLSKMFDQTRMRKTPYGQKWILGQLCFSLSIACNSKQFMLGQNVGSSLQLADLDQSLNLCHGFILLSIKSHPSLKIALWEMVKIELRQVIWGQTEKNLSISCGLLHRLTHHYDIHTTHIQRELTLAACQGNQSNFPQAMACISWHVPIDKKLVAKRALCTMCTI